MTGKKSEHKAARKPGLPKPGRTARQKEISPEEARIVLGILAEEAIDKTMRKLYPPRVVRADEKLPLALSGQEQKLLSDSLALFDLPKEQLELIEGGKESVIRITLSDWDLFADSIAVECNHCRGARRQEAWHALLDRIQGILDAHRVAES